MNRPYKECDSCVASAWCKLYSGESEPSNETDWCSAAYRFKRAYGLTEIPRIYKKANRFNYKVDDNNRAMWEGLTTLLDNIVENVDDGMNFLLFGTVPGTGKTYTAITILIEYLRKTCLTQRFDFENPLALYVSYTDLMDAVRYRRDENETLLLVEAARNVPLLLLDDIGSGTSSAFTIEQTYMLLNHRFNQGLSTIVTSNLNPVQLKSPNVLGERNVSRLLSNCKLYQLKGFDRRLQGGMS